MENEIFLRIQQGQDSEVRLNAALETAQKEITARKIIEEERQMLITLVENSSDMIGVAGLDGKVLFINKAGQKLLGLKNLAEAQQKHVSDFSFPDDSIIQKKEVYPKVMAGATWHGRTRRATALKT